MTLNANILNRQANLDYIKAFADTHSVHGVPTYV